MDNKIQVIPLGAGQDVGRSCIIVTIGGKNVMLDCGMHMGFNDERRFPDFTVFTKYGSLNDFLSCVIISHFHLDHCGALPYMTEVIGYDGPIYMTHPTKAICPILLEDYRKVMVERKGEKELFTSENIKQCMKKVTALNLHELVRVEDDLFIKPYYAGHVLGAAMFLLKYGDASVLYTGDFNMTPDRHLGAAWVDKCRPTLLITESTYATTVRDSKRCRESEFLKKIHECVENGGKVLIPVFALGRAQELCILLDSYWERMNIKVPIYFSTGLTEKATHYYRMFISWTNEKIKKTFVDRNMFDFKHIKPYDKSYTNLPEPMVVFATPGMLHGGQSLAIFRHWASNEKNMVVLPGYCVNGTVGQKILSGCRLLEFENNVTLEVKLTVEYMSFSAHADAKGILQLIRNCEPKNVMLVHGEGEKMSILAEQIRSEFEIDCFYPANGESIDIPVKVPFYADMSVDLLTDSLPCPETYRGPVHQTGGDTGKRTKRNVETACEARRKIRGALVIKDNKLRLLPVDQALKEANVKPHVIRFINKVTINPSETTLGALKHKLNNVEFGERANVQKKFWSEKLHMILSQVKSHYEDEYRTTVKPLRAIDEIVNQNETCGISLQIGSTLTVESIDFSIRKNSNDSELAGKLELLVSWDLEEENFGSAVLKSIQNMDK